MTLLLISTSDLFSALVKSGGGGGRKIAPLFPSALCHIKLSGWRELMQL